jgi:hypothetical protein
MNRNANTLLTATDNVVYTTFTYKIPNVPHHEVNKARILPIAILNQLTQLSKTHF